MTKLYWLIPFILAAAQLIFTVNSQSQIRYEELADSVRNVFWMEHREIYDGTSSSIGWYGILLIVYKIFGFSLYTAKFFRLILYGVSMLCLGLLLKRFSVKWAWVPFLLIGLSPSFLFFNTLQTPHGSDLLFFPIVLFLITSKGWIRSFSWAVAMWAWLTYPTFIFYLPALVLIYFWVNKPKLKNILLALTAFLIPLITLFVFVQNRSTLIFDPKLNSGLFRGAGTFDFSLGNFSHNLAGLMTDLFIGGKSYHFEVFLGDFSLVFPILAVVWVFYNYYKFNNRYIILASASLLGVLVLASLTFDPSGNPGMRRYSPALAAFYALFVIVWQSGILKKRGIVILSLLLIHHLMVFPINLAHLKDTSPYQEPILMSSFDNLVQIVQKEDLKLVCPEYCRVVEAYAAVSGACVWNHLDCHQVLGQDPKTAQFIPLSTKLWDEYYFEH